MSVAASVHTHTRARERAFLTSVGTRVVEHETTDSLHENQAGGEINGARNFRNANTRVPASSSVKRCRFK